MSVMFLNFCISNVNAYNILDKLVKFPNKCVLIGIIIFTCTQRHTHPHTHTERHTHTHTHTAHTNINIQTHTHSTHTHTNTQEKYFQIDIIVHPCSKITKVK